MGRKLAQYVHINGQVFAPGDEPPADVAEQITNPAAWEGADEEEPAPRVHQDRSSFTAEGAQQDQRQDAQPEEQPAEQQARRSRGNK